MNLLSWTQECTRDAQCEYGYYCSVYGYCLAYFSELSGLQVDCETGYCHKCSTFFAYLETDEYIEEPRYATCIDVTGFALSSTSPHECASKADCIAYNFAYDSNKETIYTDCECGYSKNGEGYCKLLPGDEALAQYIKYFEGWINSKQEANCNTARRFSLECMEDYMDEGDYYHLVYYKYKSEMWPKIQNVDKCTKEIFASEYWEAKEDLEHYEDDDDGAQSLASLMATAIFALLIIL